MCNYEFGSRPTGVAVVASAYSKLGPTRCCTKQPATTIFGGQTTGITVTLLKIRLTFPKMHTPLCGSVFEGCCAGSSTVRFSYEGGAFNTLGTTSVAPFIGPAPAVVPVPASVYFLVPAFAGLARISRRKTSLR